MTQAGRAGSPRVARITSLAALSCALAPVACEDPRGPPGDLEWRWATMEARVRGPSETVAYVQLFRRDPYKGHPVSHDLDPGGRFYLEVGDDRVPMHYGSPTDFEPCYSSTGSCVAKVNGARSDAPVRGSVAIVYERDGYVGELRATAAPPADFEVTREPATEEVSRAEPLVIRWSPAPDPLAEETTVVVGSRDCGGVGDSADDGELVIGAGEIQPWDSVEGRTCLAKVEVKRCRRGDASEIPSRSDTDAWRICQVRHSEFVSTP